MCEEYKTRLKNPSLCKSVERATVARKIVHVRRSKKYYNKIVAIQEKGKRNDVAVLHMDFM